VMKKYPDDLEAAAFYAVALLGTCEYERQTPVYMRAAAVAEEVFAKNPQHPGAVHYLIHAYDDPVHAPLGLRPARVYAKIAGSASHALHMPSHIFFALGMWDEANATNEASIKVADERVQRKGLGPDQRNYHSLLWLEYGYQQVGRQADARRVLMDLAQSASKTQSPRSLAHLAFAQADFAIETGQPANHIAEVDYTTAPPTARVALLTSQGLMAARNGKHEEARSLYVEAKRALETKRDGSAALHASMPMAPAKPVPDDKVSPIMLQQLEAALLWTDGKKDEALALAAKAAAEEDALTFDFGPPVPVKPAHELAGEMLLEAGRPKEARDQFERALTRAPRRALSMQGLAKAARQSGDTATAQRTLDELNTFWRSAS
jgi:tetratricopeptide (TPR) repeat protein